MAPSVALTIHRASRSRALCWLLVFWAAAAGCGLDLDDVARIAPDEARDALERQQAVAVDTRYRFQYEAGHIKGAICMPLEEIEARADELPRDKQVITYCS
jgi:predicted sulfurtransferase